MAADVQLISTALIQATIQRAQSSPRRRINHNLHAGPEDNPHRFLNVLLRGTYVVPHRHLQPPKSETFLVLEGSIVVFCFDDSGRVTDRHSLNADGPLRGIDLAPGVWHTIVATSEIAVCFEVKPGPWDPVSDKEFAAWAPPEHDGLTGRYLDNLLVTCPPDSR